MSTSHTTRILTLVILAALLLPVLGPIAPMGGALGGNPAYLATSQDAPDRAEWTFLVYLDADNNLEGAGIEDLNEMETVGSTDEVNIVVQMDRAPEYDTSNGDWEDTRRFYVVQDDDPATINSEELDQLGELNMGDPETLVDFTLWGMESFPAKKYLLVLWDHGGAFKGVCWDDTVPGLEGEEVTYDWLSMPELSYALGTIHARTGEPLDLVGFDACLMAQMAVQYEIRHHTRYCVASGYSEPGEGWPYEGILPPLVDKPTMGPEELGRIIVSEYVASYTDREEDPQDSLAITQALFDMDRIGKLGAVVDRFSMLLSTRAGDKTGSTEDAVRGKNMQIAQARRVTNSYDLVSGYLPTNVINADPTGYALYDIIDLMENLKQLIPLDRQLHTLADEVIEATWEAMPFTMANEYHGDYKGANGLSIYFPSGDDWDTTYSGLFDDTAFGMECHWDEFLIDFYSRESARETPPGITLNEPIPMQELAGKEFTMSGSAYDLQDTPTVEVKVDGGEWREVPVSDVGDGQVHWKYQLDLEDMEEGNHTISVRSVDGDGRQSPIIVRDVSVKPDISVERRGYAFIAVIGGAFMAFILAGVIIKGQRRRADREAGKRLAEGK